MFESLRGLIIGILCYYSINNEVYFFIIFNSFIAELAKQWMSFCRDGQNGISKICVDGCDVVSENSGSDVKLGWI